MFIVYQQKNKKLFLTNTNIKEKNLCHELRILYKANNIKPLFN